MEKDTITYPVQITTQEDVKLVEEEFTQTPYRHPHHKSRDLKRRGQLTENMYTIANELQDVTLSWKCNTPKTIEL